MAERAYIKPPENPTVEQCRRFVTDGVITIGVSSNVTVTKLKSGETARRVDVKSVTVKHEREMLPELVMHGPTKRGEVNSYLGIDGRRHYFNAATGEAIGSAMHSIPNPKLVNPMQPRLQRD